MEGPVLSLCSWENAQCFTQKFPQFVLVCPKTKTSVCTSDGLDQVWESKHPAFSALGVEGSLWRSPSLRSWTFWNISNCGRQKNVLHPKYVHRTYEYVRLYGKGKLRQQMELRLQTVDLEIDRSSWIVQGVLIHGRGIQKSQCQSDGVWGRLNQPLLVSNMEEGATSQRMWVASGSWKRQETDFSVGSTQMNTCLLTLI